MFELQILKSNMTKRLVFEQSEDHPDFYPTLEPGHPGDNWLAGWLAPGIYFDRESGQTWISV